jgi:hypothetical protein
MNTLQKMNDYFFPAKNKQIVVGRPSLAAKTGGHGGPPHL